MSLSRWVSQGRAHCGHVPRTAESPPGNLERLMSRGDAAHVECAFDDDLARHRHVSAAPQADFPSNCPTALPLARSRAYPGGTSRGLHRSLLDG